MDRKKPTFRRQNVSVAIMVILVLAALLAFAPDAVSQASAKTTFSVTTVLYPTIGKDSPTLIAWVPTSTATNPLTNSPDYIGLKSVWPNAVVTFTRPDGSTDVVNGPLKGRPSTVQGRTADVALIYTPNMIGTWTVSLYWPGDATYNEIRTNDTFHVGAQHSKRTTWAYLSLTPHPKIGIGQHILINAWVTPAPIVTPDYYEDYMFTITSPSGVSTKIGPMDSELPGTVWFDYPLTELGEWTIKFEFPGDWYNKPCSITRTVTVQQEAVPLGYPDTPLPTEEWSFPINVQNREWRNIAGPWYQAHYNASNGAWNPYTEAPKSAHVLWKLPAEAGIGGFVGSPHSIQTGGGSAAYGAGDAGIYAATVPTIRTVMNGRGYYSLGGQITCVDMRTGEKLWTVPGSFNVGAERSRLPVLYQFGSRFVVYNALTGAVMLNVTGASMTFFVNPYVYMNANGRLVKWSTEGNSDNFASRVLWNVTDPVPISHSIYSYSTIIDDLWVGVTDNATKTNLGLSIRAHAINAFNTTTGELVYSKIIGDATNPDTWVYRQGPASGSGYGIIYFADVPFKNQGRGYIAFDVKTGNQAWVSESADAPWGNFWAYMPIPCGNGMVYAGSYAGFYAFNATDGKIVWHYLAEDTYHEEPYGSNIAEDGSSYSSYSFGSTGAIVGGDVVFAPTTEHSPTFVYRNQQLYALNAFTGDKLWSIQGVYVPTAVAYGTLLASDTYNGHTYAFGKGNTATTVAPSSKVIGKGNSVLLEGTVLDMSSAQAGTAAISDADQEAWMEYLHMQQPKPDAKGVPVRLTAIDSNGNTHNVATVTTDINGKYAVSWTPPVEGTYQITATFDSTQSYYGSQETTYIAVTPSTPSTTFPAPSETTSPTTPSQTASPSPNQPNQPSGEATVTTYIAIAAVVVIAVVIAAAIALRKRRSG